MARLETQTDLEMLVVVGGRERTAAEYGELLAQAGFSLARILPLEGMPWCVMEGVKGPLSHPFGGFPRKEAPRQPRRRARCRRQQSAVFAGKKMVPPTEFESVPPA